MKKVDLAYIAGIIDGEGYIGISARKQVLVSVSNTSLWLCNYLKFSIGYGSVGVMPRYTKNSSPAWHWFICSKKAMLFLELILPFLKLKRPQAELAIQVQRAKGIQGRPKSEAQKAIEEANYILAKEYKNHVV